jgi:hypothetical protein
MDDRACRFVEDEQLLVLVDDVQGNRLGLNDSWRAALIRFGWKRHGDAISGCDAIGGLARLALNRYVLILDQALALRAAQAWHTVADHLVEATVSLSYDKGDQRPL